MNATEILQGLSGALLSGAIEVVDLTQPLSEQTPILVLPPEFGQCAPFSRTEISRYDERGVAWYWNNFCVGEHVGTHFDAPVHWITGRDLPENRLDTIPARHFVAPAVVIDCSAEAASDPDYLLTPADLERWEAQHGKIPANNWVLMRTDWSKRTGDAYTNRSADGPHTPGPSTEAVRFMLERGIMGFGGETIGNDAGQAYQFTPPYPAHNLIHGAGRYGLQCLTNLDRLPPTGSVVLAAPLKIEGGSGSPLRVLALVDRSKGR